jgi:hypothetical protein
VASYSAAAVTAHGQECPATIHGARATTATWPTSSGLPLGFDFEGAALGAKGSNPPWTSIRGGLGVRTRGLACVPAQAPGRPIVLRTRAAREPRYGPRRKKGRREGS